MKILHYTLGLPPVRSGGLTKYAFDIMKEQVRENIVFHLYPGNIDIFNKQMRIKQSKKTYGINQYQIINSLPLPLFRGVKEPEKIMGKGSSELYYTFLKNIEPDIIHIHTFMGIHKEFLEVAKTLNIKLVYTTHDYFGICPTINLYRDSEKTNCTDYDDGKGCINCNINAMGTNSLLLSQTPVYPLLKKLKRYLPITGNISVQSEGETINVEESSKYVELRNFYFDMFDKIDTFHFNSTLTEKIFKNYLPDIKGQVIGITHAEIKKGETKRNNNSKIKIGYLGPFKDYKGFFILLETFKKLPIDCYELHLYGDEGNIEVPENAFIHGRYTSKDLSSVFSTIDVLIVPSLWNETFGFVALEGLSYGTPIIVSENVGSKDLVNEDFGWRIRMDSTSQLLETLKLLNREILNLKQMNITENFNVPMIKDHCRTLEEKLYT